MGRRATVLTVVLLGLLAAGPAAAVSAPATHIVCPDCELRTLTAALARVRPGDRIVLRAGLYRESPVVVDKPVEIVGEGGPVLDGAGEHEILTIRADDVTVRGLVLRNSGTSFTRDLAGIRAEHVRNCQILGNRLERTFFGIYLAETQYCLVKDNEVRGVATSEAFSGNAIHLWNVDRTRLLGNRVSGHRDGIYLEFVRGSLIEGNVSEGNLRYGLHFMYSERNDFRGNRFRANGAGVAVMYSRWVAMLDNRFEDNWGGAAYGLLLKDLSDSRIAGNRFTRNTTGLYAEGANRLVVEGNDFARNGWAVRVMADSLGVVFAHNRFLGNTFEVTTNGSRSYNAFLENYWSDYAGYDLDRDGIGDVPHRPVRLFALLVEQYPPAIILLRSPLIELLDVAERLMPVLTPRLLADRRPLMRSVEWSSSDTSTNPSAR